MLAAVLRSLPVWLAAAWAFSLTTIGFFVVPLLFVYLPTPAMAGVMAAKLFAAQTAVSTVCALLLLLAVRGPRADVRPSAAVQALAPSVSLLALAGALLSLLVHFGVSPRIVARENLALWHGVGTAMYGLQWLCAMASFARLTHSATHRP